MPAGGHRPTRAEVFNGLEAAGEAPKRLLYHTYDRIASPAKIRRSEVVSAVTLAAEHCFPLLGLHAPSRGRSGGRPSEKEFLEALYVDVAENGHPA